MRDIFTRIYLENIWKEPHSTASGPGSTLECSEEYLIFLYNYIRQNNIKSVLDLGCGDFNLMQHFNFNNINYHGIDIVEHVIQNNIKEYQNNLITFECSSIIDYIPNKKYDLIICKDVLQHLPVCDVKSILNNIKQTKFLIINDCFDQSIYNNRNIVAGEHTGIDLEAEPYHIDGKYIFEWYACATKKRVYQSTIL
jgi:SAM-dependent methyltransferase